MARRRGDGGQSPDADGWGPEVGPGAAAGRGGFPLGRVLLIVLVLLLAVAVAMPLIASARLDRMPVDGLASSGSPTHVLIIGSDSREGLTPEEERELSTGSGDVFTGERADTILMLTVDRGDAALLSFPRDLWVERCDGSMGRINAAVGIDGPECLVDAVRGVSGLHAHHVVRVTFGGFRDVVDAVGGVELCLDDPIADRDAGIDLPAGCQVLDGADSLGFVRVRKIDNDLERTRRQQEFVQALAREVATPAVLFNPLAQWRLSGSAGQAVSVDDSLGPIGLARLGWASRSLAAGNVATHVVPVTPFTTSGGAMVVEPDQPEADQLFASFRDGSVLGSVRAEDPEIERADVRVSVANGAGISGLAGTVADRLAELGYQIGEVTNTDPREATLVRYPPDARDAAELVADDVPGPTTLEESTAVDHVTVLLSPEASP